MHSFGLTNCKPAPTPSVGASAKQNPDGDADLDMQECRLHGGIVRHLHYLSFDRCDVQSETNACAKEMKQPTKASWTRLKRLARRLAGTLSAKIVLMKLGTDYDPQLTPVDLHSKSSTRRIIIDSDDLFALAAAAYTSAQPPRINLHPSQRFLLDGNLTMSQNFTALLPSSESYTQNSGSYIRGGGHLPPAPLRQRQHGDPINQLQPAARACSLAFHAHQIAVTHLRDVPLRPHLRQVDGGERHNTSRRPERTQVEKLTSDGSFS